MPESPLSKSDGVVRFLIESNGVAIDPAVQVLAVHVRRAIGQIASARIEIMDGDLPSHEWTVADGAGFAPGAAIRISAGYGDHGEETIFAGIVVHLGVRIEGDGGGRLIVECRHRAVALTASRRNRIFNDQTDSHVMQSLAGEHGLAATVTATSVQHRELVQYGATDWDFLSARAQANGLLVLTDDDGLCVKPPDTRSAAALKVAWGVDLMEFRADLDARAPQLEAAPTRIGGHMKFQGSAKARPAGLIEVTGVGKRFKGSVFVTAVEHEISEGQWTTRAEFGQPATGSVDRADVSAPPASAVLPGIGGLHVGVVSQLDPDPAGEMRIQVHLPALAHAEGAGGLMWARLAQWQASNGFGAFFVPEVGDDVVVGFFNEDPRHPVVLGSLYSARHQPPVEMAASHRLKSFTTKSGHRFEFDDQDQVVTLTTKAGNKVVLSDKDKSILLVDQNQNQLTLDPDGIRLAATKDVSITAKGSITLDAVGAIALVAKGDIRSQGLNVSCEAQVGFIAKGGASAELSAAGQTMVKGALVMIN